MNCYLICKHIRVPQPKHKYTSENITDAQTNPVLIHSEVLKVRTYLMLPKYALNELETTKAVLFIAVCFAFQIFHANTVATPKPGAAWQPSTDEGELLEVNTNLQTRTLLAARCSPLAPAPTWKMAEN